MRHPEYRLEVLRQRSEEELLGRYGPPMAKLGLVLMQHSGRPALLNRRLPQWVPLLQQVYATPYGPADLEASVCYARLIGNEATGEVLHHVLGACRNNSENRLLHTAGRGAILTDTTSCSRWLSFSDKLLASLVPTRRAEELMEIASSYVRDVLQAVHAEREAKAKAEETLAEALLRILDARDAP